MRIAVFGMIALAACGEGNGTGTVQVVLEAEDTIPLGLDPGSGEDNIVDGYQVRYTKYLQTFGGFRAAASSGEADPLEHAEAILLDLRALPAGGKVIATFEEAPAIRFDDVAYASPAVSADVVRDPAVSQADFDAMAAAGANLLVEGTATMAGRAVAFSFLVAAAARYEHCGPEEGDKGFAVVEGGTAQAAATYHGDHFWFNAFPEGFEGDIVRRASWIDRADLDRDGAVTAAELDGAAAATLFPSPEFNLGGSPVPVTNGATWLRAQGVTVGHFQGEGECAFAPL